MYLLYVDESGSFDSPTEPFVVGGIAVREDALDDLRRRVESIVAGILDAHLHKLELHASPMRSGNKAWRGVPGPVRNALHMAILQLLSEKAPDRRLFAVARSPGAVPHVDPLERVFEELLLRFNSFLDRTERSTKSRTLGLVVADEAKYEKILQPLVRGWRDAGTRFGKLTRVVEVPLFVDSAATRLIQLADFVTHAVFRNYAFNDSSYLTTLLTGFDETAAKMHGLTHLTANIKMCGCFACATRVAAVKTQ